MNFFERQHAARNTSARLVVLFVAAVVGIVVVIDLAIWLIALRAEPLSDAIGPLVAGAVVTLLIIGGGTLAKTLSLRGGGAAVALGVGAVPVDPSTTDPSLRRYVNIVEEMSLASGVPMPRLFVLDREPGINAFAAGYTPADAAITVTAGALNSLNRDELQGVVGHEFSHILNGDMRLNVRLIALLSGILLLGLIGLRLFVFGGGGGRDRGRDNTAAVVLVLALAMTILGFIGQFFAKLIQAAVSRQREWLADASAVQFTRQTVGLEGALKKIAGLPTGSMVVDKHAAAQVNHMLFGEAGSRFSRLFATHPPLMERISALDPTFRPDEIAALSQQWQAQPPRGLAEDANRGLVDGGGPHSLPMRPHEVTNRVGTVSEVDLARGARLSAGIPPAIRQLASQPSTAVALVIALSLSADTRISARQLQLVEAGLGTAATSAAADVAAQLGELPELLWLPVVSLALPALTSRPPQELDALVRTLDAVALADGAMSVFEYALTRMVASFVRDAQHPARRSTRGRADVTRVQAAAVTLLAEVAAAGNDDEAQAEHAFRVALEHLTPGAALAYPGAAPSWAELDAAWPQLDSLDSPHKQRLVEAVVLAVRDDGVLTAAEAELLRVTCALLHCPLPSLIA